MFFEYCDELNDLGHITALFLIIDLFKKTLHDYSTLTEEKINDLLDYFFELLPSYIKKSLTVIIDRFEVKDSIVLLGKKTG